MASYGEIALVRGMNFLADSQAAIANNLANIDTSSFKRRMSVAEPTSSSFFQLLNSKLPVVGYRECAAWEQGNTRETGNSFNIALDDPVDENGKPRTGFLKVRDDKGNEYFTRDGDMQLDKQGRLVTRHHMRYLDQGGQEIVLLGDQGAPGTIAVSPNGTISDPVSGQTWGPLGLYAPPRDGNARQAALDSLTPVGNGLYTSADDKAMQAAPDVMVRQHQLEGSNVDSLQEMVRMITVQRTFGASQRALSGIGRMQESLATNMLR